MTKKLYLFVPIFLVLAIMLTTVVPAISMSEDISTKVFRMHILANSDTDTDQQLKLLVRDKILKVSNDLFENCDTVDQAINVSKNNLDLFRQTAQNVIAFYGYTYDTQVLVDKEYFNTRYYDNFTLPAGKYDCLKIIIGSGQGHNWWCVMFPSVCLSGCTSDFDGHLTDEEKEMICQDKYVYKFKVVEMYEKIKSKM